MYAAFFTCEYIQLHCTGHLALKFCKRFHSDFAMCINSTSALETSAGADVTRNSPDIGSTRLHFMVRRQVNANSMFSTQEHDSKVDCSAMHMPEAEVSSPVKWLHICWEDKTAQLGCSPGHRQWIWGTDVPDVYSAIVMAFGTALLLTAWSDR